jgi:hypothetical protein
MIKKVAENCHFSAFPLVFDVKPIYFIAMKILVLKARAVTRRNAFPGPRAAWGDKAKVK